MLLRCCKLSSIVATNQFHDIQSKSFSTAMNLSADWAKKKTTWNIIEHFPFFMHRFQSSLFYYWCISSYFIRFCPICVHFHFRNRCARATFYHTSYGMHAMHLIVSGLDSWLILVRYKRASFRYGFMMMYVIQSCHGNVMSIRKNSILSKFQSLSFWVNQYHRMESV